MAASSFWTRVAPAITLFLLVLSLYLIWQALNLPTEAELIPIARTYFEKYGLITVFVGALFEGLFLIGIYLPGTFLILLGILLANGDLTRLVELWIVIITGLMISYSIDFALGKYGWYRLFVVYGLREQLKKARKRLSSRGLSAIFTSFWQINIAALTATAAGTLQFSFIKFVVCAICAAAAWMAFWITVITLLGPAAVALVNLRFILFALILWITWLTFIAWYDSRPKTQSKKLRTKKRQS